MSFRTFQIGLATCIAALIGCNDPGSGQEASSDPATVDASASTSPAQTKSSSNHLSANPCELLTESLVREFMSIPASVAIEQEDGSDARHPTCNYKWRVMTEAEEAAANEKNSQKMRENIEAGRKPNDGIDYNIPTHEHLRLTAVEFETAEEAQSGLESARSYMVERGKQPGNKEVPWDEVDGVGDKAYYHGTQLSFVSDRLLMHLDPSPLEAASELANRIIG